MAKKTPRPARTLLVLGLAILVLYGLAALGQTAKPRLGLDLEGGTRITLSAVDSGGAVTQTKLNQAASIVDARVNGSGVSEAEVSTQGNRNIIVEIPGKNASNLVDAVKRTAQLRFRIVAGAPQPGTPAASQSADPSPSASPSGSPSASPSSSATPNKVSPSKASESATAKPRPAPFADPTPSGKASPSAQASTPASQAPATQAPATQAPGDPGPGPDPEGRQRRRPAGLVAEPRRLVADQVRRLPVPDDQGRGRRRRGPGRHPPDHL